MRTVKIFHRYRIKRQQSNVSLHKLIKYGCPIQIRLALARGNVDLNERDPYNFNRTPLYQAILLRKVAIAKILIQKGADVNVKEDYYGFTPLHLAAKLGLHHVVKKLLSCGRLEDINASAEKRNQTTPLHVAILYKKELIALLLVRKGASVKKCDSLGRNAIHHACEFGFRRLVKRIWYKVTAEDFNAVDCNNFSPFALAILRKRHRIIQYLIKKGIDVNFGNPSPMWHAVNSENMEALELISQREFLDFEKKSPDGLAPLELALAKECHEAVMVILKIYIAHRMERTFWQMCLQFEYRQEFFLDDICKKWLYFGLSQYIPKYHESNLNKPETLHLWFKKKFTFKNNIWSIADAESCYLKSLHGFSEGTEDTQPKILSRKFPLYNPSIEDRSRIGSFRGKRNISLLDLDNAWLRDFCCIPKRELGKSVPVGNFVLQECSSTCYKTEQCLKVRLLIHVIQLIQEKILHVSDLMEFLQPKLFLVGSVAEGTRLFSASEADVSFKLNGLENHPLEIEQSATSVFVPDSLGEKLAQFCRPETNLFDYPLFLEYMLICLVTTLRQISLPDGLEFRSFDFTPCDCCRRAFRRGNPSYQSHCKLCAPTVTHTKIGACLIFTYNKVEFLTMDFVPLFPLKIRGVEGGTTTLDLVNRVILTCVNETPVNWLSYLKKNVLKRDLILAENLGREAQTKKLFHWVSLKLLHYGAHNNYIILPAQQVEIEKLNRSSLRMIYSYLKGLKDLLDIPVKSYIIKKVIASTQFSSLFQRENPSKLDIQKALQNACLHITMRKQFLAVIDENEWKSRLQRDRDFDEIPIKSRIRGLHGSCEMICLGGVLSFCIVAFLFGLFSLGAILYWLLNLTS